MSIDTNHEERLRAELAVLAERVVARPDAVSRLLHRGRRRRFARRLVVAATAVAVASGAALVTTVGPTAAPQPPPALGGMQY